MNIISMFRRLRLFRKHFFTFLPYLTFGKLINLLRNEYEMRLETDIPKSFPPFIKIDPSPLCNLRCPDCKQSSLDFKRKFNESMNLTLDSLKKVIEPMSAYLLGVSLSLNGEPFMNKSLADLIYYLHKRNISVNFPSNFSVEFSVRQLEDIVKSGLDTIYISLDGASEETYRIYRVGGNLNLVLNNVGRLRNIRKLLGSRKPKIIWKFVVFEHNKHEIEIIKKDYKKYGFDSYRLDSDFNSSYVRRVQRKQAKAAVAKKQKCFWLWNTFMVLWDGTVYPCCNWNFESDIFMLGNAFEQNITDIWQGENYSKLRKSFMKDSYGSNMNDFCKKCLGME